MYSVVMMLALSGGAQTPDWGWGWGGCCGCSGYSCCGCWGGWRACGCCGWRLFQRPWGWRFGRCGCCGGFAGCAGCVGCVGCVGEADGGVMMPGPRTGPTPERVPPPGKTFYPGSDVSQNNEPPHVFVNYQQPPAQPATVVVNLPADAKLTFNGWTSSNPSTTRRFRTPSISPGQEFAYTIRAEIVRDGQTIVQNHQVVVRAGQETRVHIDFPTVVLSQNQE